MGEGAEARKKRQGAPKEGLKGVRSAQEGRQNEVRAARGPKGGARSEEGALRQEAAGQPEAEQRKENVKRPARILAEAVVAPPRWVKIINFRL